MPLKSSVTALSGLWGGVRRITADDPTRRGAEGSEEPTRNPARAWLVAETAVGMAILVWLCHGFLEALVFELEGGVW